MGTNTPNLDLYKPDAGEEFWGGEVNANFDTIDTALSKSVVQIVNAQTGAVNTGTTQLPLDDTTPQITEGDEYMTLAITPTSATNKLIIEIVFNGANSVGNNALSIALFQDATANALAAAVENLPNIANSTQQITIRHYMAAGTASSTTFRLRAGGNSASTTTFNGHNAGQDFNGLMSSSITITEVKA